MYNDGLFWAIFGMAWVFGCVAILIVIWHLRSKRRMEKEAMIHQERIKAMDKGIPLPEFPDLNEEAKMDPYNRIATVNPKWPLGVGALCIFGGLGFMVAMLLSGDNELWKLWSMGLIGVFFGVGMMMFYRLTRTPEN